MDDKDNRNYFRLTDVCEISYLVVSKSDAHHKSADQFFDPDPNFEILREIHDLTTDSKEILKSITNKDRQVGSYLHNLNRRVELLARGLNATNNTSIDKADTQISEGGISFTSHTMIKGGDNIALKLIFHPSLLGISCFALVKHCRLIADSHEYRIGAEFLNLEQSSQRLLGRHIIQKQSEERRERLRKGGHSHYPFQQSKS